MEGRGWGAGSEGREDFNGRKTEWSSLHFLNAWVSPLFLCTFPWSLLKKWIVKLKWMDMLKRILSEWRNIMRAMSFAQIPKCVFTHASDPELVHICWSVVCQSLASVEFKMTKNYKQKHLMNFTGWRIIPTES